MKLLCFGCGYVAQNFAGLALSKGAAVTGTTRGKTNFQSLQGQGIRPLIFKADQPVSADVLNDATHILVSIPPSQDGDPVINEQSEAFKRTANLQWLGYLSTTGVYGDHQGEWVTEESLCSPTHGRSQMRLKAETAWLDLARRYDVPVHIFRLSGIYGPDRSVLEQIKAGAASQRIYKPGRFFSRIHRDDITQTLWASAKALQPGEVYNLADDEPAATCEVIAYACRLFGVEPPPLIPFEDAVLSPTALSFYRENKRVSNRKIKDKLNIKLLFPTYREGLDSIFKGLKAGKGSQ